MINDRLDYFVCTIVNQNLQILKIIISKTFFGNTGVIDRHILVFLKPSYFYQCLISTEWCSFKEVQFYLFQ